MMKELPKILPEPPRPYCLGQEAKWLSGEGAGSWFEIAEGNRPQEYIVTRRSPSGDLECRGVFIADRGIYLEEDYQITYPSHCLRVTLVQFGEKVVLRTIGEAPEKGELE